MPDPETYHSNFLKAVESVEQIQRDIAKSEDIRMLNQHEREAQQALFALQHTAMWLGSWIQGTVVKRRKEINDGLTASLVVDSTKEPAPILAPASETPKKKRAKRTKKTKKEDK